MTITFKSTRIEVTQGGGTKVFPGRVAVSGDIQRAECAIKSFGFDFLGDPEALNIIQIATNIVNVAKPEINFEVECKYVDKGGPNPRSYVGFIDVLVIADTEPFPVAGDAGQE